jgi:undecaprenyl-phosphate 4-deoxy-4-formamido-L-arabinose transferase
MHQNQIELSIVVPMFNSSDRIREIVSSFKDMSNNFKSAFELVLVDDGSCELSRNQTIFELSRIDTDFPIKLVLLSKQSGQFISTRYGISQTSGNYILTLDDDLSVAPIEIKKLINELSDLELDFIVCPPLTNESCVRRLGTNVISIIGNIVYRVPKNHKFSSIILFRSEFIKNASASNQFKTVPGWFYTTSSYFRNVSISIFRSRRPSNYNLTKLVKSTFNILGMVSNYFYYWISILSLLGVSIVVFVSFLSTLLIQNSPRGYLSQIVLSAFIFAQTLILTFQMSGLSQQKNTIRENLIPFRILNF